MKILIIGSAGYIGRRLTTHLELQGYQVTCVDAGYYGITPNTIVFDYNNIPKDFYEQYEVIILLAGHSSIIPCEKDKEGSFNNNVVNFKNLLNKLNTNQRLLYASSASVCNGNILLPENAPLELPFFDYNMHKQVIELIAYVSPIKTIGMRFGTVGGYSPNPRLELIINSMYYDGLNKGEITVSNWNNIRSYLGLTDACNAISELIDLENPEPIYNIASGSCTIGDIAKTIEKITKADINFVGNSNNYSFAVDTSRIEKIIPMKDSLESICDEMGDILQYNKAVYSRDLNLFHYVQNT